MKMLLLFLCCGLAVAADSKFGSRVGETDGRKDRLKVVFLSSGQHEDIGITGCSDFDGEDMYGLDGEERWYADFRKGEGVYPLPDFVDPIKFEVDPYSQAVADQQTCKSNLGISRKGNKDMQPESGNASKIFGPV